MENTELTKKNFLNSIKKSCIDLSISMNIMPSLVASLSIIISKYGTTPEAVLANNIFSVPVNSNWFKRCFSKDTNGFFEFPDQCKEKGAVLYRYYEDYTECIEDFITLIKESRRSEDGPFRYDKVFGKYDYKKAVYILTHIGFVQDYLNHNDNEKWYNDLIHTIEEDELYLWDIEMEEIILSRRKHRAPTPMVENKEDQFQTPEHIYRVRLDWDKPDTQIFSSPVYEDALAEAENHEGYKIFIDDDGELFFDPWEVEEEPEEKNKYGPGIRVIYHPIAGGHVYLSDTPVYRTSIDKVPFAYPTGTFYYYDSTIINDRARITVYDNIVNPNPEMIFGYIKIR